MSFEMHDSARASIEKAIRLPPFTTGAEEMRIDETKVLLFGVPFTLCSRKKGLALVEDLIGGDRPRFLVLANAHTLNLAFEDDNYRAVLQQASIVLRDGTGVAWAMKKMGKDPDDNFMGTDFIPFLCQESKESFRIFLLGAAPGVAEKAAAKLRILAPQIEIGGYHHGFFSLEEEKAVLEKINCSGSHLLLVAMGNPKQEKWIFLHVNELTVPLSIGVGALFDYLAENRLRAPLCVRQAGFEWLYRLLVEPRRLWRRYLIGIPKFILRAYMN